MPCSKCGGDLKFIDWSDLTLIECTKCGDKWYVKKYKPDGKRST